MRRWATVGVASGALILTLGIGVMINRSAEAAMARVVPDGVFDNEWADGTHTDIDEGANLTPDYTGSGDDDDDEQSLETNYSFTNVPSLTSATRLDLHFCAYSATNAVGGELDALEYEIDMSGENFEEGSVVPPYRTNPLSCQWYSDTYTGSWSQAAINSLEININRSREGSGSPEIDDMRIVSLYIDVSYTSTTQTNQTNYRWYENANSTTPGTPLVAQNTEVIAALDAPIRLRQIVRVDTAASGTQRVYRLEYGRRSTTCSAVSYQAVGTGNITYHNNPSPADGATITNSGADPTDGSRTIIRQHYAEANPIYSKVQAASGQAMLWDFALYVAPETAPGTYCFRIVDQDDQQLTGYTQYPLLVVESTGPELSEQLRGGQSVIDGVKQPFSW